ncbi:serine/threonine-protein kinase [Archangium lansingense]|uniref:Protein kinase n=1 Tax=Archangium lansingense TaxID=2995310 RepID=A0ABT4AHN1_9BACT|nr:serine/threonine-protein kinase [Archangium lansinium]MCY1081196.1 protein kinase [Archangium lansinium]
MGRSSSGSDDALEPLERTVLRDPLIGAQLGEYVIRERVGEGGMGIVYRGEQPLIGKQVAVKVLRSEVGEKSHHVERLLAEARAVNAIRHRGIIDIFSFGRTPDGRQYFVMEYLEGSALDAHLAEHGLLPLREVLRISNELLDALAAAHKAGVIHRDLKPNNLFLVRQPGGGTYVKVLDFGLAKQTSSSYGNTPQTQQGLVMGTPEYMAPEQACAQPVSPKTDLYAFGVMLFQMLTGQLPFTARSSMELLIQHVTQPPPSPLTLRPELFPELAELTLKLLAKAPEERPAMAKVRSELQRLIRFLEQEDGPTKVVRVSKSHPVPRRPPEPRPLPVPEENSPSAETVEEEKVLLAPRRSRAPLVAAVGGGLLLTLGVGVILFPRAEPKPVAPPVVAVRPSVPAEPPPTLPPSEPAAVPESATPTAAVASATGPEPTAAKPTEAAEPVRPAEPSPTASPETPPPPEPASGSVEGPRRNTAQGSVPAKGRSERNPLLVSIERMERKLRLARLPADEEQRARESLDKARASVGEVKTSEDRKQFLKDLAKWERWYLGAKSSAP